jgi:hypothetical protein
MGIARFYRWLSERYPLINEVVDVDNVPEFDNFYLDMNGIIHNCSHGNTGGQKQASEEHMWLDVFKYISTLVYKIRPKKLLYLAVDGVAPRAKMNQQRSRRFRAAHDAKEAREKKEEMQSPSSAASFDSNCITPGTEFMDRLVHHLQFFVQKKLAEDPIWADLEIVLSGPEVPGEGEHKIMDYIRSFKSQPGYDNNTRHCLYGLDADLIMLSLASHEPNFALLREEIDFSFSRTPSKEVRSMIRPDRFQLLHISLLREYLGLDFFGDKFLNDRSTISESFERVIDDFVFFCFLVGNDFLPHLPFSEIGEGGLNKLFECYKKLMVSGGDHYLVKFDGKIDFAQLFKFLESYLPTEHELVGEMLGGDKWKIGQTRVCNVGEKKTNPPARPANSSSQWNTVSSAPRKPHSGRPQSVPDAMAQYYDVKLGIPLDDDSAKSKLVFHYLEALQWIFFYYYKGPPSWDWYYPYHYSPFAADVVSVLRVQFDEGRSMRPIEFELGTPFLPFQQLMAVLPPASGKNFLPSSLYQLMVSPESPISTYYPDEFLIDMDGVRVPWGGTAIIPFVDEIKLVEVTRNLFRSEGVLTAEERTRNSHGLAKLFSREIGETMIESVVSTLPEFVKGVSFCSLSVRSYEHSPLPAGMPIFPHRLLAGYKENPDFPSLVRGNENFASFGFTVGSGVKVFNSVSRKESIFVKIMIRETGDEIEKLLRKTTISCNYPFYSKTQKIHAITTPEQKFNPKKSTPEPFPPGRHENDIDWVASKLEETGLMLSTDSGKLYDLPLIEVADGAKYFAAFARDPKKRTSIKKSHVVTSNRQKPHLCLAATLDFGRVVYPSGASKLDTGVSPAMAAAIQTGVQQILIISQSVKYAQWFTLAEVAIRTGAASTELVWTILGEVWIRMGKNQEEVGMNIWNYASTGEPMCLPGYSRYVLPQGKKSRFNRWDSPDRTAWRFSALAVKALVEYMRDQPELVREIQETCGRKNESHSFTVQGKRLFEKFNRPSSESWVSEFLLSKLVSYVNGEPFKQLSICDFRYESVLPEFVPLMGQFVVKFSEVATDDHIRNDNDSTDPHPNAPSTKSHQITPGSRGIYTRMDGLVAPGSWGTVIGVFGTSVDVMLDIPSLNASSLNGACPESRGIRIPHSDWFVAPEMSKIAPPTPELMAVRNKVIAELVVEMNKGESKVKQPSTVVPTPVVAGTKISVEQLFGGTKPVRRRPAPPAIPTQIPEFLIGKIRPAPTSD